MVLSDSSKIVPTALSENCWQLWLLTSLYIFLALLSAIEFVRILKHSWHSFRASIIGVAFLFCFIRGLFTLVEIHSLDNNIFLLYFFLYFLPLYLQYCVFSLLVLFVIKCILVIKGNEGWIIKYLYPFYLILQTLLLIVCLLISFLLHLKHSHLNYSIWDQKTSLYSAIIYTLLASIGSYYCVKCYSIISAILQLDNRSNARRRLQGLFFIISLFFVIFLTRGLYNILYFCGSNPIASNISHWIRTNKLNSFHNAFLLFYLIFEILPLSLLIFTFWYPFSGSDEVLGDFDFFDQKKRLLDDTDIVTYQNNNDYSEHNSSEIQPHVNSTNDSKTYGSTSSTAPLSPSNRSSVFNEDGTDSYHGINHHYIPPSPMIIPSISNSPVTKISEKFSKNIMKNPNYQINNVSMESSSVSDIECIEDDSYNEDYNKNNATPPTTEYTPFL